MILSRNERGFEVLKHPPYTPGEIGGTSVIASSSSAIGDYDDAYKRPGSSFLWIGLTWHLSREEVAELVARLQNWLHEGSLALPTTTEREEDGG